jgi:hypothetical protein
VKRDTQPYRFSLPDHTNVQCTVASLSDCSIKKTKKKKTNKNKEGTRGIKTKRNGIPTREGIDSQLTDPNSSLTSILSIAHLSYPFQRDSLKGIG